MKSSKIVVTGGTGYIGSHTAACLLEQGYEVILIDNLSNSDKTVLKGIATVTGVAPALQEIDLRDFSRLEQFFCGEKDIAAVIHFAALKAVGESVEQPLDYYENNLYALINLLRCMQQQQVPNLIFSSSATVYGEPESLPIEEHHPVKPATSPYGNTKKIGEDIIRDVSKSSEGFQAISLRYFNPIGAHPSGALGERPQGIPNNLMPYITQTAAGIRKELQVFGDDYDTKDGTAVRDYIHVVDLAEAHVKAVERLLQNKQESPFEVFNLGTGNGFTVLEVIHSFEKANGIKLLYRIVGRRPGDVLQTYAATQKANQELNWTAKRSLDEMTYSAWQWEQRLRRLTETS
ncbi:MAG TPA: UDP-glucose 4-epimerase GalE [Phaeodactylibacter sp.]|nr:UDP-glucose 4-epimerase GalE [Phaeodactylibacter sp.]